MQNSQNSIQSRIDEELYTKYHQICFSSSKKHVLNSLLAPNHPNTIQRTHQQNDTNFFKLDNNIVNQYIFKVYEKYNIEDPIKKLYRLANIPINDEKLHSIENSLNMTQVTQISKLSTTKRKLMSLRQSFKRDNYDAVSINTLDQQKGQKQNPDKSKLLRLQTRNRKEIGHKNKSKISFKNTKTQCSQNVSSFPAMPYKVNEKYNFLERRTINKTYNEVPIVFRYCPMCQQIILEYNIKKHESICLDIQKAYNLSYEEVLGILNHKIKRMQNQVQSYLLQNMTNKEQVMTNYFSIMETAQLWLNKNTNFDTLKAQLKSFSISFYDNLVKLNYFRLLLDRISKEANNSGFQ